MESLLLPTVLYALSYAPYSGLSKSAGAAAGGALRILPVTTLACVLAWIMIASATHSPRVARLLGLAPPGASPDAWWRVASWWRLATFSRAAWVAGFASAAIILASTYGYGLDVSIVLPLLLMKGGVMLIAPAIDRWRKREITPRAKATFAIALVAVAVALWEKITDGPGLLPILGAVCTGADPTAAAWALWSRISDHSTRLAIACAAIYVVGYFAKLSAIDGRKEDSGFLVGEMTLTAALALPAAWALAQPSRADLLAVASDWRAWAAGAASQCCGLFGGLIFMSRQAHSVCVPVNRCASLVAGFAASFAVGKPPTRFEVVGGLIMLVALWVGTKPTPIAIDEVAAAPATS